MARTKTRMPNSPEGAKVAEAPPPAAVQVKPEEIEPVPSAATTPPRRSWKAGKADMREGGAWTVGRTVRVWCVVPLAPPPPPSSSGRLGCGGARAHWLGRLCGRGSERNRDLDMSPSRWFRWDGEQRWFEGIVLSYNNNPHRIDSHGNVGNIHRVVYQDGERLSSPALPLSIRAHQFD